MLLRTTRPGTDFRRQANGFFSSLRFITKKFRHGIAGVSRDIRQAEQEVTAVDDSPAFHSPVPPDSAQGEVANLGQRMQLVILIFWMQFDNARRRSRYSAGPGRTCPKPCASFLSFKSCRAASPVNLSPLIRRRSGRVRAQ